MQTETQTAAPEQVENLGAGPAQIDPSRIPAPAPLQPSAFVESAPVSGGPRSPAPESRSHAIPGMQTATAGAIVRGDGTVLSREDVNAALATAVEQFDITPDEIAFVMQKFFMHDILDYRRERDNPRNLPVQVAA